MRPPICGLCGQAFRGESSHENDDGDLVQFADFRPLPEGMVGHPDGLEWFCSRHLSAARQLSHLTTADALANLHDQFGPLDD